MKTWQLVGLGISTLLQILWISFVGRHYGILLICGAFFSTVFFFFSIVRRRVTRSQWGLLILLGAASGFAGGAAAALVAEIALRGPFFFERAYPVANLYFFPVLLLGWIYGALLFVCGPIGSAGSRKT